MRKLHFLSINLLFPSNQHENFDISKCEFSVQSHPFISAVYLLHRTCNKVDIKHGVSLHGQCPYTKNESIALILFFKEHQNSE